MLNSLRPVFSTELQPLDLIISNLVGIQAKALVRLAAHTIYTQRHVRLAAHTIHTQRHVYIAAHTIYTQRHVRLAAHTIHT